MSAVAWSFGTPGWVDDDLPADVKAAWSDWQAHEAQQNVDQMLELLGSTSHSDVAYLNPATDPIPQERTAVSVEWEGFPAKVVQRFGTGAAALREVEHRGIEDAIGVNGVGHLTDDQGRTLQMDVRDRQDEYLEWAADWDGNKLRKVVFVAEGYDYWDFLFTHGEAQRVADLYSSVVGKTIDQDELRVATDVFVESKRGRQKLMGRGDFNWRNRLNSAEGIVHLSHKANALSAEVNLAVTSAVPRTDARGMLVDAEQPKRLLCCTNGGDPNRSSDPIIAAGAYAAVTDPAAPRRFTLTNPIGLYIKSIRSNALTGPGGQAAPPLLTIERGRDATNADRTDSRILRLRVEVPRSEGYLLGDMLVDGDRLTSAGQLAQLVSMHLLVDVWAGPSMTPSTHCTGGCCRSEQLLNPYPAGEHCGPGATDAFPGLVSETPEVSDLRTLRSRVMM